ncbi:MAG: hypothetical protein AB7U41_03385 [Dongiaceae bacterium]
MTDEKLAALSRLRRDVAPLNLLRKIALFEDTYRVVMADWRRFDAPAYAATIAYDHPELDRLFFLGIMIEAELGQKPSCAPRAMFAANSEMQLEAINKAFEKIQSYDPDLADKRAACQPATLVEVKQPHPVKSRRIKAPAILTGVSR